MKNSSQCLAPGLALITVIAVISAKTSADSTTGTASAIAIAPVNASATASTYSESSFASNDCLKQIRSLISCIKDIDEDGVLRGDPVSNVMLDTADESRPTRPTIGITVVYN